MALFIRPPAADTYVDQLQSCRPEILCPQLVHDTPKTQILKKYTGICFSSTPAYEAPSAPIGMLRCHVMATVKRNTTAYDYNDLFIFLYTTHACRRGNSSNTQKETFDHCEKHRKLPLGLQRNVGKAGCRL